MTVVKQCIVLNVIYPLLFIEQVKSYDLLCVTVVDPHIIYPIPVNTANEQNYNIVECDLNNCQTIFILIQGFPLLSSKVILSILLVKHNKHINRENLIN